MIQTKQLAENLRYLLWKQHGHERDRWIADVRQWFGCSSAVARKLLKYGQEESIDSGAVLKTLARQTNISDQELAHSQLLPQKEVLANNIDCLFSELNHGKRVVIAAEIGVDISTVSRWRRGKLKPSTRHLEKLHLLFGLEQVIDLTTEPLFLSIDLISESQRREWLKIQVSQLPSSDLKDLFPALERLLGGYHENH